jgi:putative membrane protein
MYWILRWFVSAIALIVTVHIGQAVGLNLSFHSSGGGSVFLTALIACAVFGIVNAIIRPILLLVSLPITCLTLGAFSFVINALMFLLTSFLVPQFHVGGFLAAGFGTIIMSVVSMLLEWVLDLTTKE